METRYLKTLVVAAETCSFSRTAEALNLTQSAVSQRIKFLEDRFDQQLFDRSGSTLELTEVGARIVDKAQGVLAKEQELLDELQRFAAGKRLSLACTPTFGTAFLPRVLNQFMLQNADMADLKFIFMQPESAIKGLRENAYDLAVIEHCQNGDLEGLLVFPLPEDELVFISAPRLELGGETLSVPLLLKQRLYARRDGCSSKYLLKQNLEAMGSNFGMFGSVVISDDLRLTIESVQAGNGISFISRSLVGEQLAAGTLCAHRVPEFRQIRCRSAVLHPHRAEEPLLKVFLDCVRRLCGEIPQERNCSLSWPVAS